MADTESFRVRNHGLGGPHTLGACPEGHRDSLNFVNPDYLMALIAVPGTTISPYSFFGQTSTFVWRASLESKPHRAGKFYTVIAV